MKKNNQNPAKTLQVLFVISTVILISVVRANSGVDTAFSAAAYGALNGTVNIVKRQPDGKILVGGTFTEFGTLGVGGLARLNADGTPDTTFQAPVFGSGAGVGGVVLAIGVQSNGKIIVAGDIYGTDEVFRPGIRRLNSDGSIDLTFQEPIFPFPPIIYDLEILPDDKILIAGNIQLNSGNEKIVKLNSDGTVDSSFNSPIVQNVKEIEVSEDGEVFAGTINNGFLYKLTSSGSLSPDFTTVGFNGAIESLKLVSGGKVLVGGSFSTAAGFQTGSLARIANNGSIDLTFNQNNMGLAGVVMDIRLLDEGKMLILGSFFTYNGVGRNSIARLNSDGSLDAAFLSIGSFAGLFIQSAEVLQDGNYLLGLSASTQLGSLQKVSDLGVVDQEFGVTVTRTGWVSKIVQQSDGKYLLVGHFVYVNGAKRNGLARLNQDGSLDTGFVPFFNDQQSQVFKTVAAQSDGKVIIGNGNLKLIRLNVDGSQDNSFQPTMLSNGQFNDIQVLANGQIIVAGSYSLSPGTVRIAKFNSDGSVDASFGSEQPNGVIHSFAVQKDDKIFIGGEFSSVAGVVRGRIARLNANGTLDSSFNPPGGANDSIFSIDVQSDGKVLLGGTFTGLNGNTAYQRIGRLNSDGSIDTAFQPLVDSDVMSLKIQSNGLILAGGRFSNVNGNTKNGLVRFRENGTIDGSFDVRPYTSSQMTVRYVGVQSDQQILVAGEFMRVDGVSAVRVARLTNPLKSFSTPFDFDGDGRADITVFRPETGAWYSFYHDSPFTVSVFGMSGDVTVPADYDGDGKTDNAIFRPSTGTWWYKGSLSGNVSAIQWGIAGDVPMPSDFDGDGKDDRIVYRPSNNTWYRSGSTAGQSFILFGQAGDIPLVADMDGDGKSDPTVFRPSTGTWWYSASSQNGAFRAANWGMAGDIPVPADYDGDGKTDMAVYRPLTGVWYVVNSSNQTYNFQAFGLFGDRPVAADYDGDGKADIAVFRPSDQVWYILQSTAGFAAVQWGMHTDVPAQASYLP